MTANPMEPIIKEYERHITRLHEIHLYALQWAADYPGPLTKMFEMSTLGLVHHCEERIRMSLIMKDLFDFPPPGKPDRKRKAKISTTEGTESTEGSGK